MKKTSNRKINGLIALAKRGQPGERENAKQKLAEMLENGTLEYNKTPEIEKDVTYIDIYRSIKDTLITFVKFPLKVLQEIGGIPFKDWFYSRYMFKIFVTTLIKGILWFAFCTIFVTLPIIIICFFGAAIACCIFLMFKSINLITRYLQYKQNKKYAKFRKKYKL